MRTSLYPWIWEFELCLNHYTFLSLNPRLSFAKFMQTNTALHECLSPVDTGFICEHVEICVNLLIPLFQYNLL